MSRIDTRRTVRRSVAMPCEIVSERRFRLLDRQLRDLSPLGRRAERAWPVLTGERVFLCFRIPGTDRFFDATGHVARVIHGRRPGESSREFSVEFEDVGLDLARMLDRQLAFFRDVRAGERRSPEAWRPSWTPPAPAR